MVATPGLNYYQSILSSAASQQPAWTDVSETGNAASDSNSPSFSDYLNDSVAQQDRPAPAPAPAPRDTRSSSSASTTTSTSNTTQNAQNADAASARDANTERANDAADTRADARRDTANNSNQTTDARHDAIAASNASKASDARDTASATASKNSQATATTATSASASTDDTASLTAQDPAVDTVLAELNQKITPQGASALLSKIDQMSSQLTQAGIDPAAQQQMKDALQSIVDSGTPESISDILTDVTTGLANAADSTSDTTASDIPTATDVTAIPPSNPRLTSQLFAFLRKGVKPVNDKTAQAPQNTSVAPQAAVPNLSAALVALQGAHLLDLSKASNDNQNKDIPDPSTQTVVQVTPLSADFIIASATTSAPTTPSATTATQNTDAIDAIDESNLAPAQTIDTLIPPLSSGAKKDLPDVNLPGADADGKGQNAKAGIAAQGNVAPQPQPTPTPQNAPATQASDFSQYLQNATGAGTVEVVKTPDTQTNSGSNASNDTINAINGTQGLSGTVTTNAIAPTTGVATRNLVSHASATDQVSAAVSSASKDGINHITIQMSPGDMGRVEVKMHTDAQGQTQIVFTVDKPETFDTLSRDARSLEHSLQESGIKADTGSMQFNLRQQPQPQSDLGGNGQFKQSANGQTNTGTNSTTANTTTASATLTKNYTVNLRDGIDIHA